MVISDNGLGIPDTSAVKNSAGFGMHLVNMLTDQIGGSIKIECSEGTKFVVEFKL